MNDTKWKQKIYGPYSELWKILRILQFAEDYPEMYERYMEQVQKFEEIYPGNQFAEFLYKAVLLRADDIIARMNREEDK